MSNRTFHKENSPSLLASAASASYTQSWSNVFADCDRVVYMLVTHASANITFNVQIASDTSGTGAASLVTDITANAADKIHTIEIAPAALTSAKRYVSALATRSAGTYTLLRIKRRLRTPGNFTLDSGYVTQSTKF